MNSLFYEAIESSNAINAAALLDEFHYLGLLVMMYINDECDVNLGYDIITYADVSTYINRAINHALYYSCGDTKLVEILIHKNCTTSYRYYLPLQSMINNNDCAKYLLAYGINSNKDLWRASIQVDKILDELRCEQASIQKIILNETDLLPDLANIVVSYCICLCENSE